MAREYVAPFHISFLVHDLQAAEVFYGQRLGFEIIRRYDHALHFDCYGNQLVAHKMDGYNASVFQRQVEDDEFVVPHAGVILPQVAWDALAEKLVAEKYEFYGEPRSRFVGKPYEQKVMFLKDPSGNALEFKCYLHHAPEAWA